MDQEPTKQPRTNNHQEIDTNDKSRDVITYTNLQYPRLNHNGPQDIHMNSA